MIEKHCVVLLEDRTLVTITGQDSASFLQRIITTDINQIIDNEMLTGALLSPQGKIITDFLIGVKKEVFYVDIHYILADSFIKNLSQYKLHANFEIKKESYNHFSIILNNKLSATLEEKNKSIQNPPAKELFFSIFSLPIINDAIMVFFDKRFFGKYRCMRLYDKEKKMKLPCCTKEDWNKARILYGLAEAVTDFAPLTIFPHDINYDQIVGALSFKKGCYIGQEVVSRTQHRGSIKKRVVVATGTKDLPIAGTAIKIKERVVGILGTVFKKKGLAFVRLDHIKAAIDTGLPIMVHDQQVTMSLPENIYFQLGN